jgi:hypothetical protein
MERIIQAIHKVSNRRGDTVEMVVQQQRYLHVLFTDQRSGEISDGEFYITPNDATIQFRLSSMTTTASNNTRPNRFRLLPPPSLHNIDRAEMIRKELQWFKITHFTQSTTYFILCRIGLVGYVWSALGPKEEMRINTINGGN